MANINLPLQIPARDRLSESRDARKDNARVENNKAEAQQQAQVRDSFVRPAAGRPRTPEAARQPSRPSEAATPPRQTPTAGQQAAQPTTHTQPTTAGQANATTTNPAHPPIVANPQAEANRDAQRGNPQQEAHSAANNPSARPTVSQELSGEAFSRLVRGQPLTSLPPTQPTSPGAQSQNHAGQNGQGAPQTLPHPSEGHLPQPTPEQRQPAAPTRLMTMTQPQQTTVPGTPQGPEGTLTQSALPTPQPGQATPAGTPTAQTSEGRPTLAPGEMAMFCDGEAPRPGAAPRDEVIHHLRTAAQFRSMTNAGMVQGAAAQVGTQGQPMTLAQLMRRGGSSSSSRRESVESRESSRDGLGYAFALGARRGTQGHFV